MDGNQIEHVLSELRCDRVRRTLTHIRSSCPVARWRHRSGLSSGASFAVQIEPGGASPYMCHACGESGGAEELIDMVQMIGRRTRTDTKKLVDYLVWHNAPSKEQLRIVVDKSLARASLPQFRPDIEVGGVKMPMDVLGKYEPIPVEEVLPESDLERLKNIPDRVMEYLTVTRRLTPESIRKWELGWHPGTTRISFPIRNVQGKLVGISGRAFREGQEPKYIHSTGFKGAHYLYGEHLAKRTSGLQSITSLDPIHLVEGFFDAMYLNQCGYPAVAMHGSFLSKVHVKKLSELWNSVVIVPDGDGAGRDAADRAYRQLQPVMARGVRVVTEIPDGMDPDQLSEEQLQEFLGTPEVC